MYGCMLKRRKTGIYTFLCGGKINERQTHAHKKTRKHTHTHTKMTKFNSDVVLNDMFLSLYLLWIVDVYYSRFLKVVTNLLSGSAVENLFVLT